MADTVVPPTSGRRWSARIRLTALFTLMLVASGATLGGLVYAFMRFVPTYNFVGLDGGSDAVVITTDGADGSTPVPSPTGRGEARDTASTVATFAVDSTADVLSTLLIVSILTLVFLTLVGSVIAWIVSGRMLRPLHRLSEAARRAGDGDLSHRLALDGPRDEFRELAETFDDMLERLDRSFHAHERFAANASHELQTPLTASKALLDVILADPLATAEEWRDTGARVLRSTERSIRTTDALLDLAGIADTLRDPYRVGLDGILDAAVLDVAPLAQADGIRIETSVASASVVGDGNLLQQLADNLLRNAIVHNIASGTVEVDVRMRGGNVYLRVSNTGALISDAASLVEPFVRGATRDRRGRGLGLALADAIVRAHRGELILRARPAGGLDVTVVLPAAE